MSLRMSSLNATLDKIRSISEEAPESPRLVSHLLRAAQVLIETAERISANITNNDEFESASGTFSIYEELPVLKFRRFQQEHVSPLIQNNLANTLYKIRRVRDNIFQEEEMFGEPAWDILLDLMTAERDHKSISVTSVCMASCVPPTTALRWIQVLESRGYIERAPDYLDRRRYFVNLTDKTRQLMNKFSNGIIQKKLI